MNKNEVLKILETAKDKNGEIPMRLVRQAFEKLPEPCEDTISRDGAINEVCKLPSVGELIRCKDCKFYIPTNRETKSGICSLLMHQNFGDDWYCAGAERREG